ncbi:transporter [Paludibacter sp. 221]|uniref:bile acid:sodium symporter family protein n=1 Tax=Paludibacter sp. 221 TaxID=2302939 RepID=UPI0013D70BBC|nr:transporter [Paludibacter sp. 221]NDV47708.1 transporter [Paludibacter sp. 221]
MLNKIRPYMMPAAMILGGIFHRFFAHFTFLTPYLIFSMLLLTYCNLSLKNIRFSRAHVWLIAIQVFGSIGVYLLLKPVNLILAQAAMICILAPTATSAPVIARMLKGNVESLTAYSLLCNTTVAIVAPIMFSFVGSYQEIPFWESFFIIARQIVVLLIAPFLLAIVVRKLLPVVETKTHLFSNISFVLWSFALTVVTAKIIEFILVQDSENYSIELIIAGVSMVICVLQFLLGRKIGRKYDDTVAGGQGLGQKNTVLAIWMAQTYLNPIASLGPGTYVLWQNIVNSYQVWRTRKSLE